MLLKGINYCPHPENKCNNYRNDIANLKIYFFYVNFVINTDKIEFGVIVSQRNLKINFFSSDFFTLKEHIGFSFLVFKFYLF